MCGVTELRQELAWFMDEFMEYGVAFVSRKNSIVPSAAHQQCYAVLGINMSITVHANFPLCSEVSIRSDGKTG